MMYFNSRHFMTERRRIITQLWLTGTICGQTPIRNEGRKESDIFSVDPSVYCTLLRAGVLIPHDHKKTHKREGPCGEVDVFKKLLQPHLNAETSRPSCQRTAGIIRLAEAEREQDENREMYVSNPISCEWYILG